MRRWLLLLLLWWPPAKAGDCVFETQGPECDNGNVYDGYWWRVSNPPYWVPVYPTEEQHFMRLPAYIMGKAVYYNFGLMEATARVRGLSLGGYVGGVALMSCGHTGESVWILRPGHDAEGPFRVVDCPRRGDMWPVTVFRGEVVEVDWRTWQRWGVDGAVVRDVVVAFRAPPYLQSEGPGLVPWWPDVIGDWMREQLNP